MGRWRWQDDEIGAPETRVRVERALSPVRGVLAVVLLTAVYIPGGVASNLAIADEIVAAYAAFGAAVFILVRVLPSQLDDAGLAIHLVDLLLVAAIALFTRPSGTLFVLFLVFVLLAAAVRWGPTATLVTGGVTVGAFLAQALLTPTVAPDGPFFQPVSFVRTGAHLIVLTWMVGFLAVRGRAYAAEQDALSRVLTRIGRSSSFSDGLRVFLDECLAHVGSARALIAVEAAPGRSLYLWRMSRQKDGRSTKPVLQDLTSPAKPVYFGAPPHAMQVWHAGRLPDGSLVARGLGPEPFDRPIRAAGTFAQPLLERHDVSSILAADIAEGDDWRARVMLLDPDVVLPDDLFFLRLLTTGVAPALHGAYRVGRVRSRVSAMERSRFARELHDGTLQAMIGLEMEVEVLRRHAERAPLPEPRVRQIRDQLRLNIADARDLMLRLKPSAMSGADVLRIIAELAGRLRREAGLDVRVVATVSDLDCTPHTCRHLARIVQEALTNARKHSGAQTVTIRLTEGDRTGRLVIEDDGRGFAFSGRLTLEQLEATDMGPGVIKDRVRAMGGHLTIASRPGAGADIEVEWPRSAHA